MPGTNFAKGRDFRERVALWLRAAGFHGVEVRPPARPTDDGDNVPQPGVLGFPGWHIDIVSDRNQRMSFRLDEAQEAASATGAEHFAVVHARRSYGDNERPVGQSYVLLTLEGFSALLKHELTMEKTS